MGREALGTVVEEAGRLRAGWRLCEGSKKINGPGLGDKETKESLQVT